MINLLPYFLTLLGIIAGIAVPVYLMGLQKKELQQKIKQIAQDIETSKSNAIKGQTDSLETLERITSITAEELEKSLQKSITVRNLMDQVELQKTQLIQQHDIITLQTANIKQLTTDLAAQNAALEAERLERQTAVLEIENLKVSSDNIVKELTARIEQLVGILRKNNIPVPPMEQEIEEGG